MGDLAAATCVAGASNRRKRNGRIRVAGGIQESPMPARRGLGVCLVAAGVALMACAALVRVCMYVSKRAAVRARASAAPSTPHCVRTWGTSLLKLAVAAAALGLCECALRRVRDAAV